MERIMVVQMETRKDGCPKLYESTGHSPHCSDMKHQMQKYGFETDVNCHRLNYNKECEADVTFRRRGA